MKFPMGTSVLSSTSIKKISVSMPKNLVEMMGLFSGQEVEIVGYSDPLEIIIKPKVISGDNPDDMIQLSTKVKPWRVRNED
jgi:antitoxin component of MazEF toxin-antitoxin module